jgi:hypothetical protein
MRAMRHWCASAILLFSSTVLVAAQQPPDPDGQIPHEWGGLVRELCAFSLLGCVICQLSRGKGRASNTKNNQQTGSLHRLLR